MTVGGRELVVNPASYRDAMDLSKAIGRALRGSDLSGLPTDMEAQIGAEGLQSMISLVMSVSTSDEVERATFKCAERAAWGGTKITPELFDDEPEARQYFYQIMSEVIKVNVTPFFGGLFSAFSTLAPQKKEKSRKPK